MTWPTSRKGPRRMAPAKAGTVTAAEPGTASVGPVAQSEAPAGAGPDVIASRACPTSLDASVSAGPDTCQPPLSGGLRLFHSPAATLGEPPARSPPPLY